MGSGPGGSGLSWLLRTTDRKGPQADVARGGVELTQQVSQAVTIQRTAAVHHTRCASSGSGLPSALSTPPQPHGPTALPTEQQEQQQQQGDQPCTASVRLQKSVRWQHEPQGAEVAAQPQCQDSITPAEAAPAAGSSQVSKASQPTPDEACARPTPAARQQLPPSDDQQLDNYLRYLLQEQHPHRFLYYPGWGLTESGCAAIGAFLARDKRIKVVTLSDNNITDEGLELIAEGLACNGSLLSLDLSNNKITSVGAVDLAEALHSDKCRLAELLLSHNRIGEDGADALAGAAASSSSLKKLKLSGNPISNKQLEAVQHALKTREYKIQPSQPQQASKGKHLHKASSGLQFDIELMESQSRSGSSSNLVGRAELMRLPPATAVAPLVEAQDPLESSIAMQTAHLMAELHEQLQRQQHSASVEQLDAHPAAAGSCQPSATSLVVQLAIRLACRGYDVVLRTCFPTLGGVADEEHADTSSSQEHHHKPPPQQPAAAPELLAAGIRHTFMRVSQPTLADEAVVLPAVIVDPTFKDQWLQGPHATERLQAALDALPQVLCLAEARLWHLVELLCRETAAAFKDHKMSLPPWRQTPAVLDKWLSSKHLDIVVEPDSSVEELERRLQQPVTIAR